jgi:KDO2-lipid IV(A) lauroyltransferase
MVHVQAHVALNARTAMSRSSVLYYSYRALGVVAPFVPPAVGYWLASQVGTLAYYLYPHGRVALKDNLSHVLGSEADEATIKATALEVFHNLAKNYYELFHKHRLSEEEATSTIVVRDLHHIEEGLRDGRGLIVVSAHFGPFDALWQIGRSLNLLLTAPAEHLEPERLYQYVCGLRDRAWIRFLPIDRPLMELYRALRRGEIVALAGDRDITRSGIVVDFFGAQTRMPDGAVQLALRTGANLTTCFALRQPDNTAVLQVEPVLQMETTGDFERDVRVNVPKVVARMEEWIRRYPGQWLVLHPVWEDARHAA